MRRCETSLWEFSLIIRPTKPRLIADPYISPISGKRGNCALCTNFSDLTENHVPPESVGNFDRWQARSYMTAITANRDLFYGRSFRSGIKFRTICAECNNGLGGREDKAIGNFYASVRRVVESTILVRSTMQVSAKPNQIFKGLLAHMVSANDNGFPSSFDLEARNLFFGRKPLALSSLNLFYWIYRGPGLFLMRNAYVFLWHPHVRLIPITILKLYPLGFVFTQEPWLFGMPNLRMFFQKDDQDECDVPVQFGRADRNLIWPATTSDTNAIMAAGDTYGIVASR